MKPTSRSRTRRHESVEPLWIAIYTSNSLDYSEPNISGSEDTERARQLAAIAASGDEDASECAAADLFREFAHTYRSDAPPPKMRGSNSDPAAAVLRPAMARVGRRNRQNLRELDREQERANSKRVLALYLDTVVSLATASANFTESTLATVAMMASFLAFFALGYGAGRMKPVLAKSISWRELGGLFALALWRIALKLLLP